MKPVNRIIQTTTGRTLYDFNFEPSSYYKL